MWGDLWGYSQVGQAAVVCHMRIYSYFLLTFFLATGQIFPPLRTFYWLSSVHLAWQLPSPKASTSGREPKLETTVLVTQSRKCVVSFLTSFWCSNVQGSYTGFEWLAVHIWWTHLCGLSSAKITSFIIINLSITYWKRLRLKQIVRIWLVHMSLIKKLTSYLGCYI